MGIYQNPTQEDGEEKMNRISWNSEVADNIIFLAEEIIDKLYSATNELSNDMIIKYQEVKYESLGNIVNKIFETYNEKICGDLKKKMLATWDESDSSLMAFVENMEGGESASEHIEKIQNCLYELLQSERPFTPISVLHSDEVNVKSSDFDEIEERLQKFGQDMENFRNEITNRLKGMAEDNGIYVSLLPFFASWFALVKAYADAVTKVVDFAKEEYERKIKIAEEMHSEATTSSNSTPLLGAGSLYDGFSGGPLGASKVLSSGGRAKLQGNNREMQDDGNKQANDDKIPQEILAMVKQYAFSIYGNMSTAEGACKDLLQYLANEIRVRNIPKLNDFTGKICFIFAGYVGMWDRNIELTDYPFYISEYSQIAERINQLFPGNQLPPYSNLGKAISMLSIKSGIYLLQADEDQSDLHEEKNEIAVQTVVLLADGLDISRLKMGQIGVEVQKSNMQRIANKIANELFRVGMQIKFEDYDKAIENDCKDIARYKEKIEEELNNQLFLAYSDLLGEFKRYMKEEEERIQKGMKQQNNTPFQESKAERQEEKKEKKKEEKKLDENVIKRDIENVRRCMANAEKVYQLKGEKNDKSFETTKDLIKTVNNQSLVLALQGVAMGATEVLTFPFSLISKAFVVVGTDLGLNLLKKSFSKKSVDTMKLVGKMHGRSIYENWIFAYCFEMQKFKGNKKVEGTPVTMSGPFLVLFKLFTSISGQGYYADIEKDVEAAYMSYISRFSCSYLANHKGSKIDVANMNRSIGANPYKGYFKQYLEAAGITDKMKQDILIQELVKM